MEYTSNSPQETFALGKRLGEQAKPGDIVFFDGTMGEDVAGITHCGIYVGSDQFVHASTYGSGGVLLTALNGNPYYSAHYIAARRMG